MGNVLGVFNLILCRQFQKTSKTGETILKKVEEKPHMDTKVLRNMSGEGAIQTMDFKVADLRKKLDRVRFENGKKTNRIEKLMAQYDKVGCDWWKARVT